MLVAMADVLVAVVFADFLAEQDQSPRTSVIHQARNPFANTFAECR